MVHPLTAVVFKKGEMEEVTDIKSISISGVYLSGSADVTYALSGSDVVPSYDWGTSLTGSQTVRLAPADEAPALEIDGNGKIGTSFIILPQTVAEGTLTLTITVVKDGISTPVPTRQITPSALRDARVLSVATGQLTRTAIRALTMPA